MPKREIKDENVYIGRLLQEAREARKILQSRNYYRLYCKSPPDRIYAEMLSYTRPVVSGRQDKRNMKPKSAVWFVYRVA